MTAGRCFIATVSLLASAFAWPDVVDLPRIDDAPNIDGVLDEAVWQDAVKIELSYETFPGENTPAPVETWAYFAEDGENIYIAFDARDPRPGEIRAFLRDRDKAWNDDFVGVGFDTYNDNRRSFDFYVNPLGVQMDSIFDETEDGDGDDSWDAIWESAGRMGDSGYFVEMRIPLDQLRFQKVDGQQTWGFRAMRQYPRDREFFLENVRDDRNQNCALCQNGRLKGLEGSSPGKDFEIVPTLTASHNSFTDTPESVPMSDGDTTTEAGVTLRYGITPDITANLAINPDFSQIEADSAQLDVNNRFALFFPEKRPFFLEGANYFSTPIQAVFTRTVASPDIGLKLTGKRGNHTFATFAARDEITGLLFPGATSSDSTTMEQDNNAFVGRYNYGFGNTSSSLGGLIAARDGDDYRNVVAGVDGRWRINNHHALIGQYLTSETEYPASVADEFDQPLGSFDGDALTLRYEFDSRNWFANVELEDFDGGFRADSGFVSQVGAEEREVNFGRVWHGDGSRWWNRIRMRNGYETVHREDGQLLEEEVSIRLGAGGPWQSWTQVNFFTGKTYDDGSVFDIERFGLYNRMTPIAGLTTEFYFDIGKRVDFANNRAADAVFFEPSVSWNASRNLIARVDAVLAQFDTRSGESIFDARIVDARVTWQFNVRSFLRFTLQHQDIKRNIAVYVDDVESRSRDVGRQLLYSWKLNPQTVFFLGYSDVYVDNDDLDRLTATDRTWFMKIGYAWSL